MQRLRPIDTPTLHQEVQERLREYILVNRLKPDDGLPTKAARYLLHDLQEPA
jgi:DNA-binding FadR family transcriptional regulator